MENCSLDIFVSHLENMLLSYKTYDNLALYLGVPTSTLKSWMLKVRAPKLSNIDKIANKLGCNSADLLNIEPISNVGKYNNSSRLFFVRNLEIIFAEKGCYNMVQKLCVLNNVISDYVLNSYLRKDNYRTPTLNKLDIIADQLNIKTYELIKE